MSRIAVSTQEGITNEPEIELVTVGHVAGVEVATNNSELANQIRKLPYDKTIGVNLSYVTGSIDPSLLGFPARLESMQRGKKGNMGQLYVHENLREFAFMGLEKFGTLSTLAYSIRTFSQIEKAKLGIHSSVMVSPKGRGVLLIGASRVGKTRIASEWIRTNRGWQLLEDDWSEVSLDSGKIKPVTPINNLVEKHPDSFTSFGKHFLPKKSFELQRTAYLDSIVIIGSDKLSTIMSSLPFVDNNSITSDCRADVKAEINRRLHMIRDAYSFLLTNYRRIHIEETVEISDLSGHMEYLSKFL